MSANFDNRYPTKKITLKTGDDEVFEVEEEVAMEFAAVKNYFEDNDAGTSNDMVVPLPNVSAKYLSKTIEYCGKQVELRTMKASEEVKKQYNERFVREISNEEDLKEMILAVNYLDINYLLDVLNEAVAELIKNKSIAYVRRFFGVESDFTEEEEARIRNDHPWAFEGVDDD